MFELVMDVFVGSFPSWKLFLRIGSAFRRLQVANNQPVPIGFVHIILAVLHHTLHLPKLLLLVRIHVSSQLNLYN
jgi:hypothetical protein